MRVDIEDIRKQEVRKPWSWMEISESTVWLAGAPQENRGPLWARAWIAEAGELQLTGSEAKGLRCWSVGSAVPVDMGLILMVAAPKVDRKIQLGGKGLSAWRIRGVLEWRVSEKQQRRVTR